jgi:4-amino-4-deoxychorismate lyase
LPFEDRAWQYGDGLFETIAMRSGVARFLDWHLERLALGCTRLGIQPPDLASIRRDLNVLLDSPGIDTSFALVKLVVTAGEGPRGYRRQTSGTRSFLGAYDASPLAPELYREGCGVRFCTTRLARQPRLAGLKSLNRLEQVLARNEWSDPSIFEGLTFDTAGNLICGTMSNVFLVRNQTVVTPDLSHAGIAGIMRRKVVELAHRHDIPVIVRDIRLNELREVDEMFICNSQIGLLPVAMLDGRRLTVGAMTKRFTDLLLKDGVLEMAC